MNRTLLSGGVLALVTALVHIIAGQENPVLPMLRASFDEVAKRTMLAVWHMVSADLVLAAIALIMMGVGMKGLKGNVTLARFLAVHFAAYGAVFLVITLTAGWSNPLFQLPQWILLLPVAAIAWAGARRDPTGR